MRKDEKKYVKVLEYVCHITVWCVILLIPLFIDSNLSMSELNIPDYLKHCLIPVSFCILFYINYLYLVPRFLFKGKIVAYVGLDLLIIVAFSLIMPLLGQFVINPDAVPPPDVAILEQLPPKPMNMAFIMGRDIFTMILISGLAASLRTGRKIASIEEARKESEMTNLKSQFNPHFLLNTLNNIYALIAFDSEKAQTAVHELSRLLRYATYDIQENSVPLYKETEFIRNYIALMELRLPDNVGVSARLDVSPNSDTPVAPLLFISLIENAFKHGISPTEKSFIRIRIFETDDEIHCEIENSLHPKNSEDRSGSGIGLRQLQRRLEIMYEGRYAWDKGEDPERKEYHSYLVLKKE